MSLAVISGKAVPPKATCHHAAPELPMLVTTAGTKRIVLVSLPPTALALATNWRTEPCPDVLTLVTMRALKPKLAPVTLSAASTTRTTCSRSSSAGVGDVDAVSAVAPRRPP